MTKRTTRPSHPPDPSELVWEDRGDGTHFAVFVKGTIDVDIQRSAISGLYHASVRQLIGASGDLNRLKEMCQAWADENEPLVSSIPLMYRRRKA